MAAIKYENIRLFTKRGSVEGPRISEFLTSNNIDFFESERLDPAESDAELSILSILSHAYGDSITSLPVCAYESVYFESGSLRYANNEFSITVSGFPANFANAAVKIS